MKRRLPMLFAVIVVLGLPLISQERETAKDAKRPKFLPAPLEDDWNKWIVGEWEGSGESDTGKGRGIEQIELTLNGQFRMHRGEAKITEMTPEQVQYLKKNMQASEEEIERFKRSPYRELELYTTDQETGEIVAYLFDSLRCMAKGRGKLQGNREIVEWEWATGHKSTRITEKAGNDRIVMMQRTRMPDGSVMEEKGEMTRRKKSGKSNARPTDGL